ncbi:MAG: NAD-dependent epimerase/dehydratase family protein [Chlamydiia bacterium]|nr:NAD-dependent epimerase/dehydratase family protein [Chlamydiia bacterium]
MIVITGATGHLGNVLTRQFLEQGLKPKVLCCPKDRCASLHGLGVEPDEVDLQKHDALARAFEGAHTVFHLAAYIRLFPGSENRMHAVNVKGTRNVIQACRTCGVKRLVYVSTSHVLGSPKQGSVITEAQPIEPRNLAPGYIQSKAIATLEVQDAIQQGLDAVIAFPSGLLGPHNFGPSHMGRMCVEAATSGRRFYVDGGYDFVDVRDVATALRKLASVGNQGASYLLTGTYLSDHRALEIVYDAIGWHPVLFRLPNALARPLASFNVGWRRLFARPNTLFTPQAVAEVLSGARFSSKKAQQDLGFSPRPPEESLRDMMQWFKDASMISRVSNISI